MYVIGTIYKPTDVMLSDDDGNEYPDEATFEGLLNE